MLDLTKHHDTIELIQLFMKDLEEGGLKLEGETERHIVRGSTYKQNTGKQVINIQVESRRKKQETRPPYDSKEAIQCAVKALRVEGVRKVEVENKRHIVRASTYKQNTGKQVVNIQIEERSKKNKKK